jgi:hypothetical protein
MTDESAVSSGGEKAAVGLVVESGPGDPARQAADYTNTVNRANKRAKFRVLITKCLQVE